MIQVCPGPSPATCAEGTAKEQRIVRAESGEQALDALRQMKLRGDQVAVILADYRMPGLSGIEFLERAMDVYPFARRVLLTAYADTNAAIDAINLVDLDHYLLKPWDPPEEKLYPVIDDLLRDWQQGGAQAGQARPSWWGTAGRRRPPSCATSSPATRCPTAGTPRTPTRDGGCSTRRAPTTGTCRC